MSAAVENRKDAAMRGTVGQISKAAAENERFSAA
jgi:hypothetical protein